MMTGLSLVPSPVLVKQDSVSPNESRPGALSEHLPFNRSNAPSAVRTGIMLGQPRFDAGVMEPVSAGQHRHFRAEFHRIHADRALCLPVRPQHLLIDLLRG